jgi:polysaccharide pyruvyl transferase WcaK-like protein
VGYFHGRNLGDDTVVAILIHKIRERYPGAAILGFSLDPVDTARRYAVDAFPIRRHSDPARRRSLPRASEVAMKPNLLGKLKRRVKKVPIIFKPLKYLKTCLWDGPRAVCHELSFLRKCLRRLRGVDLLVVPGSGTLTDWWGNGPWQQPYSLLSWFLLARMTKTKIIALSVGAERLDTRLGKTFCKWALSLAHYRSFRDEYSRDTMEALGLEVNNPVFPDQGFAVRDLPGCNRTESSHTECQQPRAHLTVGVTPIDKESCVAAGENDSAYDRYIDKLSTLLSWLIQSGHRIAFCPTENHDRFCIENIVARLRAGCPCGDLADRITQDPILTTEALISRLRHCDLTIASRYHGVVLPLALHKPVLTIAGYGRKIGDVMSYFGQDCFHFMADEADPEQMKRAFEALEQNRHAIARHLESVVADLRARLERQYDEVFGPLDHGSEVAPRPSDASVLDFQRAGIHDTVPTAS